MGMNSGYRIILTDPPWPKEPGGNRKVRPQQKREALLPTMTVGEIFKHHTLFMEQYADPTQHTVFMWAVDKHLRAIEQTMADLGYKLHARIIWDKTTGPAPAFTVRYTHEYLLWYYRGPMVPIDKAMRGKYGTVIQDPARKGRKRPWAAYRMIDELFPQELKLELYSRGEYQGPDWSCYGAMDGDGNQVIPVPEGIAPGKLAAGRQLTIDTETNRRTQP